MIKKINIKYELAKWKRKALEQWRDFLLTRQRRTAEELLND
jgi:hypothetical protein